MIKTNEIIKNARGEQNQADFARALGKSQSVVSKYERGSVSPPADVLNKCLRLMPNKISDNKTYDEALLLKKLRKKLKGPKKNQLVQTMSMLVDML